MVRHWETSRMFVDSSNSPPWPGELAGDGRPPVRSSQAHVGGHRRHQHRPPAEEAHHCEDNCLICSWHDLLVLGGAVLDSTPHTLSTSLEMEDRCLAWTWGQESSLLCSNITLTITKLYWRYGTCSYYYWQSSFVYKATPHTSLISVESKDFQEFTFKSSHQLTVCTVSTL